MNMNMNKLIITLAIGLMTLVSCADQASSDTSKSSTTESVITSFDDLDIKPRFGGCKDLKDEAAIKTCADKRLAKFISTNLQYPEEARKLKIEGKTIISFVVEPNGSLSDIAAETNLGGGLEEEAVRVMKLMNTQKKWWIAGKKDGKFQRVQLKLPINFRI